MYVGFGYLLKYMLNDESFCAHQENMKKKKVCEELLENAKDDFETVRMVNRRFIDKINFSYWRVTLLNKLTY